MRRDYFSRASNFDSAVFGPLYGQAYSRQYPDTDYRQAIEEYVAFLQWWDAPFTLMVFPTHAPYYDQRGTWDLAAIKRDFGPLYAHPEMQRLCTDTCFCYEEYGTSAHMAECFELYRSFFPTAKRAWHNPPGHLSPGMGDEDEEACWRSALTHGIHRHYVQMWPISEPPPAGITAEQRAVYDLWDMTRRALGSCPVPPILASRGLNPQSPWGAPLVTETGDPLEIVAAEFSAYYLYWTVDAQEAIARQWGASMLTVKGVTRVLDGI